MKSSYFKTRPISPQIVIDLNPNSVRNVLTREEVCNSFLAVLRYLLKVETKISLESQASIFFILGTNSGYHSNHSVYPFVPNNVGYRKIFSKTL